MHGQQSYWDAPPPHQQPPEPWARTPTTKERYILGATSHGNPHPCPVSPPWDLWAFAPPESLRLWWRFCPVIQAAADPLDTACNRQMSRVRVKSWGKSSPGGRTRWPLRVSSKLMYRVSSKLRDVNYLDARFNVFLRFLQVLKCLPQPNYMLEPPFLQSRKPAAICW